MLFLIPYICAYVYICIYLYYYAHVTVMFTISYIWCMIDWLEYKLSGYVTVVAHRRVITPLGYFKAIETISCNEPCRSFYVYRTVSATIHESAIADCISFRNCAISSATIPILCDRHIAVCFRTYRRRSIYKDVKTSSREWPLPEVRPVYKQPLKHLIYDRKIHRRNSDKPR